MHRPRALVALGSLAVVLLTGACSEGADAFNSNEPDGKAVTDEEQVVRTPEVIAPTLPYATPPLVVPLPGPTGGVPGEVPETSAPFSPGPEGSQAANNEQ